MRLLERKANGELALHKFVGSDISVPPYAILSHTWAIDDSEEVTLQEIEEGKGTDKAGYNKIRFCLRQAASHGLRFVWIDTCCIDKKDAVELSAAINSMFRWYQTASKCYVFLSDVSIHRVRRTPVQSQSDLMTEDAFKNSRWFARGWTLQELLAPNTVDFFSLEGDRIGDKVTLETTLCKVTGISKHALRSDSLASFSVQERMSWAARRHTKLVEDQVYSLLGIFDVSMPLIYGEGKAKALRRLQEEIRKSHSDDGPMSKRRRIGPYENEEQMMVTKEEKEKVLGTLHFDQIDDRLLNIKMEHAQTCRWFLESEEYVKWLDNSKLREHNGFLWLKGKPGSGKSTLTKFTFTKLERAARNTDTTLFSFFFNARGSQLEKSTSGLYRALLVRLLKKHYDEPRIWNSLDLWRFSSIQQILKSEVLKQLLAQVMREISHYDVTLVIDALDECDEDEVREMVTFLSNVGQETLLRGRSLRVFFSSRHYPHITIKPSIEIILQNQVGHSQDIRNYIDNELGSRLGKQLEPAMQEICNRASGVFMWVVLVVQILAKQLDHGQVRNIQSKLHEIPDDLDELFRRILARDTQNLDSMKLCFQWILYASRPLTREELYFAILSGTEPEELAPWDHKTISVESMDLFILSSSKGLAEITKTQNPTVQFIHESVREFLLKSKGPGQIWADLKSYSVGKSHEKLKQCCINYMSMEELGSPGAVCGFPHLADHSAWMVRERASYTFPFFEYAVNNCLKHADIAQDHGVDQKAFIHGFDTGAWIKLYNTLTEGQDTQYTSDVHNLYILAEKGCASLVKLMIHGNLPPRNPRWHFRTPVLAAVAGNSSQALEALLDGGDRVRTFYEPLDSGDLCSLLFTLYRSRLLLRLLSAFSFDVNMVLDMGPLGSDSGVTILQWAVDRQNEDLVELLLRKGADTEAVGPLSSREPLCRAVIPGALGIARALLDHGAKIQSSGSLFQAVRFGTLEMTKLLLDRGGSVSERDYWGSPLAYAVNHGRLHIADLLLARGADVDAHNALHNTPLWQASQKGDPDMAALLLCHGADIKAGGPYNSALHAASSAGHADVVLLLLNHCAEKEMPRLRDSSDLRVGHGREHVRGEATPIFDMLVAMRDQALIAASSNNHGNIVHELLMRRADVNAQDMYGQTALSLAVRQSHLNIIEMLLDHGAEVMPRAGNDESALEVTVGQKQIVTLNASQIATDKTAEQRRMTRIVLDMLLEKVTDADTRSEWFQRVVQRARGQDNYETVLQLTKRIAAARP